MTIDPAKTYTSDGIVVEDLSPFAGGWVGVRRGQLLRWDAQGRALRDDGEMSQAQGFNLVQHDPVERYYVESLHASLGCAGVWILRDHLSVIRAVHASGKTVVIAGGGG